MLRGSDIPRLLAIAGIAVLGACSDSTAPAAAPTLARPTFVAPAPTAVSNAVLINAIRKTTDSMVVDFTVTPSGGWFVAGVNAVYFPPNSICEPSTSGYGPDTWDRPCRPATSAMRIHGRAGLRGNDKHAWIQFDEDLRFVPSTNPDRWVRLYMYDVEVQEGKPGNAKKRETEYAIMWVPVKGAEPVDEALADPTLATQVLWGTGLVTRRVKHFSGYQVTNGIASDELELY
jgi:hypothetical protein